jgi:hypothetical protein
MTNGHNLIMNKRPATFIPRVAMLCYLASQSKRRLPCLRQVELAIQWEALEADRFVLEERTGESDGHKRFSKS